MVQNLKEYLATHKCQGFKAVPHYSSTGDFVTCFFSNERCHEQRVDDLLTVYLSDETRKIVGCKLVGVKSILDSAERFGVGAGNGEVKLGLFLWVGALLTRDETQKQRYEELRHLAADVRLDRHELQRA
jgi:hypothetical protein